MYDGVCADCERLQRAALDAIDRHLRTRNHLAIAMAEHDSQRVTDLKPVETHLFRARGAAIRAYREHFDTHAQEGRTEG
jgi:hypothetical protein